MKQGNDPYWIFYKGSKWKNRKIINANVTSQGILAKQESEAFLMSDLNYHYNIGGLALTGGASGKSLMNKQHWVICATV